MAHAPQIVCVGVRMQPRLFRTSSAVAPLPSTTASAHCVPTSADFTRPCCADALRYFPVGMYRPPASARSPPLRPASCAGLARYSTPHALAQGARWAARVAGRTVQAAKFFFSFTGLGRAVWLGPAGCARPRHAGSGCGAAPFSLLLRPTCPRRALRWHVYAAWR